MDDSARGNRRLLVGFMGAFLGAITILFTIAILRDRTSKADVPNGRNRNGTSDIDDSARRAAEARREACVESIRALGVAIAAGKRAEASAHANALSRLGEDCVDPSIEALRSSPIWNLRIALLDVLASLKSKKAVAALADHFRTLKEQETALKIEIVRRLGRMAGSPTRNALSDILYKETTASVREEIAKALVALGITPDEVARLTASDRGILEQRTKERADLRSRLEEIGKVDSKSEAAVQALRKPALEERVVAVALAAFSKLENRDDGQAAGILTERVRLPTKTNEDKIIQTNALASLMRMKAVDARIAVRSFALGDDAELRLQTIEILGGFGDKAMLPLLDQATAKDKSERMTEAVSRAKIAIERRTASGDRK